MIGGRLKYADIILESTQILITCTMLNMFFMKFPLNIMEVVVSLLPMAVATLYLASQYLTQTSKDKIFTTHLNMLTEWLPP